jgi:hypothetical protein
MPEELPEGIVLLNLYGIWSRDEEKIIFASLNEEDVRLEYDMEGYDDNTHMVVSLACAYDASSLLS